MYSKNINQHDGNNTPLLSICCTTYNHVNYIKQTLDGFLLQKTTFRVEILIHDDASTDGTAEIIKEYQDKYPDLFKPIYQKINQYSIYKGGMNPRFNYPRVNGSYIAVCEGDDYWTDPFKLQKQVSFLESNPDHSFCFTGCKIQKVDKGNKIIDYGKEVVSYTGDQFIENPVFIATASMLFRKEILHFYNTSPWMIKSFAGDFVIKYCALASGKIAYLPIVSCVYNKGVQGSWSVRKKTMPTILKEYSDTIRGSNFLRCNGTITEEVYQKKLKKLTAAVYFKKAILLNRIKGLFFLICNLNKVGSFYLLAYVKRMIT